MKFNSHELALITEALRRTAIRQESEARFNPRASAIHDRKARAMRQLIDKINKQTATAA